MTHASLAPYFTGLGLAAGLIIAIGSQNMFVLRQGLKREHVLPIVVLCVSSDTALIWAGVSGLGEVLKRAAWLEIALTIGGAAFLTVYGLMAARRALKPSALIVSGQERLTLGAALATAAAFTFLNPHVYIDTVMLMGSIGAGLEAANRPAFIAGAATASLLWFSALGFGARLLAPVFARPVSWRFLDAAIAVMMLGLAVGLIGEALPL